MGENMTITTNGTVTITYVFGEWFTTTRFGRDDSDGGAGVREPRRPHPEGPRSQAAAVTVGAR